MIIYICEITNHVARRQLTWIVGTIRMLVHLFQYERRALRIKRIVFHRTIQNETRRFKLRKSIELKRKEYARRSAI